MEVKQAGGGRFRSGGCMKYVQLQILPDVYMEKI